MTTEDAKAITVQDIPVREITMLDFFAGQALTGLLAGRPHFNATLGQLPDVAYSMATIMLESRAKAVAAIAKASSGEGEGA